MNILVCVLLFSSNLFCSYPSETPIPDHQQQEIVDSLQSYKDGTALVKRYEELHQEWGKAPFYF